MSKPVRAARSNRLGGLQYSGTNSGSVSPIGMVNTLDHSMARRYRGRPTNSANQGNRNAEAQTSQT